MEGLTRSSHMRQRIVHAAIMGYLTSSRITCDMVSREAIQQLLLERSR